MVGDPRGKEERNRPLGRAWTWKPAKTKWKNKLLGPVYWPFGPSRAARHWAWDTIEPGWARARLEQSAKSKEK